jgi:hypothetical protein
MTIEPSTFQRELLNRGWVIAPALLPSELTDRIKIDLVDAIRSCAQLRAKYGVSEANEGIAHHVLGMGGAFLEFIDQLPLQEHIEMCLGGPIIVNSFGGFRHDPQGTTYAGGVHRDIRSFHGDTLLMLNMLVMLDEFTPNNGSTYLLAGSHRQADKPGDAVFFEQAERALGPAGSVLVFHSQLWHASGQNTSSDVRRALTLTLTRPFYKQQVDYPRLVGYEKLDELSEKQRQLIGYNSRVPASYDEWYQPPEKRMYKPGQG